MNNIKSFEEAESLAAAKTEETGQLHIATDAGNHHYPRYDVRKAPAVGDKVSYAMNGDYYPDGEIVKISKTLKRVTTSNGTMYHRVRQTGSWKRKGWSLIEGHIDRRNPHI